MKPKNSPYYTHMLPYFQSGNKEAILLAKKQYQKIYKATWRKNKRQEKKKFEVYFSQDEFKQIEQKAKENNISKTKLIEQGVLAYINKRYIVPENKIIEKLFYYVAIIANQLESNEEIIQNDKIHQAQIITELNELERMIRVAMISPYTLEQLIEKEIKKDKEYKTQLIHFLENF